MYTCRKWHSPKQTFDYVCMRQMHSAYIVGQQLAMPDSKFCAKEHGDLRFKAFKTEQSKMNNFQLF